MLIHNAPYTCFQLVCSEENSYRESYFMCARISTRIVATYLGKYI